MLVEKSSEGWGLGSTNKYKRKGKRVLRGVEDPFCVGEGNKDASAIKVVGQDELCERVV
jgi:hypothetical protein